MTKILSLYPDKFHTLSEVRGNITMEEYVYWSKHNFHLSEFPLMAEHTLHCDYEKILEQVETAYLLMRHIFNFNRTSV